jgi:transcription initiation factor TFIID subunit 2
MTLADPRVFYRVRAKAAQLLASHCYNASTNFQAGHALLHFFKSRYFGAGMFQLKPNDFSDFSAYFVQKAVIRAMAQLRDGEGLTPVGGSWHSFPDPGLPRPGRRLDNLPPAV